MSLMSKFAGFVLRYNIIKAIFGGDIYDLHVPNSLSNREFVLLK